MVVLEVQFENGAHSSAGRLQIRGYPRPCSVHDVSPCSRGDAVKSFVEICSPRTPWAVDEKATWLFVARRGRNEVRGLFLSIVQ